jgi:hypothetical protein
MQTSPKIATPVDDTSVLITISKTELSARGFTTSGVKQFCDTIEDYANSLCTRSISHGEIVKAPDMPREITHDHVRASAHSLAAAAEPRTRPKWLMFTHVGEYIAMAAAGAGAGYLNNPSGILTFGVGLTVAVLLVMLRLNQVKAD